MTPRTFAQDVQLAKIMWGGFYYCPNTGRIIECLQHDDKALCSCRGTNPALLNPNTGEPSEYPGVHIVRFLKPATAEAYVRQERDRQAVK